MIIGLYPYLTERFRCHLDELIANLSGPKAQKGKKRSLESRVKGSCRKAEFSQKATAKAWESDSVVTSYFNKLLHHLFNKDYEFSEGTEDIMRLVYDELLLNARSHGGQLREDKYVEVNFYVIGNSVIMYFKDDGDGFDHGKILQERRQETVQGRLKLKKEEDEIWLERIPETKNRSGCGTGTYVLALADEFLYNAYGNEVAVMFDLSREGEQRLRERCDKLHCSDVFFGRKAG